MKKRYFVLFLVRIGNNNILSIFEKTLLLSVIYSKCGSKNEKTFTGEQSIEILKIVDLISNIET